MAEINIVRIEEIPECIERTLQGIRDGLVNARKNGILAEWPEKVDFQMIVVKDWQALEVNSTESGVTTEKGVTAEKGKTTEVGTITDKGTTIEKQGGFSTELQTSGGTDRQTGTETRRTDGANSHVENGDSTTTTKQS